jgi:hypothetical protein
VSLAFAHPLCRAVTAPAVEDFTKAHAVITANHFDGFNAAEFLDAEELLIALIIGDEPAQSALVC